MFITVIFGAGCWELVNTWCSLRTLTAHLRQRGQVLPDATIALLAEDGHLVSLAEGLEEGPSPAPSMASPRLRERGTYVLVQTIKGEGGDPTRYESLLENLDGQRPELAGFPGPHRGAALAVGPAPRGRRPEAAPGQSAWPPGARPFFTAPKGGLPAVQDPRAGAWSQVRRRHGPRGTVRTQKWDPLPRGQMCVLRGGPRCQPPSETHVKPHGGTLCARGQVAGGSVTRYVEQGLAHRGCSVWRH
ncbi:uncharacterized protein C22orf15 homolog isoform X3 [Ovis canadensis]|uniref:uncharacterized protein C22orf15 homolog isoform X3 n=1 Tax=Ovis canadensis TaxID=37174 RepID=UPI00375330E9